MLMADSTDTYTPKGLAYSHILTASQFGKETLDTFLSLTTQMERQDTAKGVNSALAGRTVANLFYEQATLADVAFQAAAQSLGARSITAGDGVYLTPGAAGESLHDTVKIVACYADAIVLRHPTAGTAREAAASADALQLSMHRPTPIISAGGGNEDPSQALTDLYTIKQRFGYDIDGITLGFLGDLRSASAAHSLIELLATAQCRANLVCIAPENLSMPAQYVEFARSRDMQIEETPDLQAVIGKLDVLYVTGVQREGFVARHLGDLAATVYGFPYEALDKPRRDALRPLAELDAEQEYLAARDTYVIDPMMFSQARKNMILMHPLPRVKEIPEAVDTDDRAYYFRQVRNGLYVRMALLSSVLGEA
jgi:aspartate carbamoyltransferase catalytic subunit